MHPLRISRENGVREGRSLVYEDDDTVPRAVADDLRRRTVSADITDFAEGDTIRVARPQAPLAPPVVIREAPDDDTSSLPRIPPVPASLAQAPIGVPPVAEKPAVPVALRPHHWVRVTGGELLELDRPIHIGRKPREPRVPGIVAPRLVTVPSPDGSISANHLELHEQGGTVVVTDLRTLNGCDVHVPGAPVRPLRSGESVVVPAGTRILLGEGTVIEVLPPGRMRADA